MFFRINSLRNSLLAGLMACLAALPLAAVAQDKVLSTTGNDPQGAVVVSTEQVRKGFEERFPGLPISEVSTTPFSGLFEVRIGSDLVYVDSEVNYVLQGSLIDAKSRSDLTAKRIAKLSEVDIDTLPLKDAIKQVTGDGSRRMVVFEDPNCGYCKMLHQNLSDIDNVTVYTFLYPILSQDSHTRSRNIWCAEDAAATWKAWMLEGRQPAAAECDTPIETNLQLGRGLMVTGTPAIFFADGSRMNGAMPTDALERKLAEAAGQ
ncbi:MAG: DsbC family protein [Burkholderiaceae bacterium]